MLAPARGTTQGKTGRHAPMHQHAKARVRDTASPPPPPPPLPAHKLLRTGQLVVEKQQRLQVLQRYSGGGDRADQLVLMEVEDTQVLEMKHIGDGA